MNPFLDVVVTKSFPILFSFFLNGSLPGTSPYTSMISFSPFSAERLEVLKSNIYSYYSSNESELLIFDQYSNYCSLDTFGNKGLLIADIKDEIWY